MNAKVYAYVGFVACCAGVGVAYCATAGDPHLGASAQAALCFVFLGIFAEVLRYNSDAHTGTSVAFVPFLATAFLSPTWVSSAAIGFAAGVVALINRQSALKGVFNVAQYMLAGIAAALVYRRFGGQPLLTTLIFNWPAYVTGFVTFVLVNGILVCLAISIAEDKSFLGIWAAHARSALAYDVISLPLPYLFALVYVHYGAIGAMALGLPLLAARQLYKTNWQLEKVNQDLLQLMVAAIEARDPYTSGHSRRVARNAKIIARALGLASKDCDRVGVAALLHDVGKIHEVFAPILRKPGKLTPDERLTMESHPIKSAELVQNVSHLQDVVAAIRHHHENWDGTGYPDGLKEDRIPMWSRIIMIADTVDAMTTDRPYRAAMTEVEVRSELIKLRGKQFDPDMCDILLSSPLYPSLFERQGAAAPPATYAWRRKAASSRIAIEA